MSFETLQGAHEEFYRALGRIFQGDSDAMSVVWSHESDVTYMSPLGDLLVGWPAIRESWVEQARMLTGGPVQPEEVRFFPSSELGVVVGFERGSVVAAGETLPVDIRATSTYRLETGRWRMIGHHTDRL